MRIQHNIAALNSHRQLTANNSAVSKNLEKLSSGYRINRAGDDAAGLAISEKMRAQITGLETAQKNANDGISEGTNFNGINLLDGSLSGGANGAGGLTGASIVRFKPATEKITSGANLSVATNITSSENDVLDIDGHTVTVDWSGYTSAELDAVFQKNWGAAASGDTEKAATFIQDAINNAIDKANKDNGTEIQHITVKKGDSEGDFVFTSGLKDTGSSKIKGMTPAGNTASVLTKMGLNGLNTAASPDLKVPAADLNGEFIVTLDGEEYAITTQSIGVAGDVATQLQDALDDALDAYDEAKGIDASDATRKKITVSLNNKGQLEFTNTSGLKLGFADKDGGEVAKSLGISAEGKANSGGLTLQIGDTADDFNKLTVSVDSMSSASLGLSSINIGTQEGAAAAIDKIKTAINTVSSTRGDLGALQNRLEHTINNLSVTSENMTAAESRIRDVDMAQEMMEFTKNNILTQASQSMLAQANQLPQGVLQLLQ